jgi:fatty-acyl-CoA synthase
MDATMMQFPLSTQMILRRGARLFGNSQVISFDGSHLRSASYAEVAHRARQLASALNAYGLAMGDRVGTLCWNTQEHLEAYLAIPAMGAVLHTVNVRLAADQIGYIIGHAEDRVLILDPSFVPVVASVIGALPSVDMIVVLGDPPAAIPGFSGRLVGYEELIAGVEPFAGWPELAENSAAVMCYTSGTTGNPKGVVYSHRSLFLHSLASLSADAFAISNRDTLLMVPPMFHANAWGAPFSGWLAGSDFVLPGPHLQPEKLAQLIALTRPTFAAAVPTILNDLLLMHSKEPIDLSCFRVLISGGSAVSPALIERVRAAWGVGLVQGWGMTETSPMCVLSFPPTDVADEDQVHWRAKSGRPVAGMEVRIVDDLDQPLPEDGQAVGHLQLRGPWVTQGYYLQAAADRPLTKDGWLRTGDAGTIDSRGYVQVTDRTKDLIKSGGEWISSVDLENAVSRYPGVNEVAVIAVPDPRWEERPLVILTALDGHQIAFEDARRFLSDQMAKFMVPEYWASLSSLPKTSVGKIDKRKLRAEVDAGTLTFERVAEARGQEGPENA